MHKETRKKCLDDAISAGNASGSKNPANFEEWMRINLGEGISEFFMIPYNKKCYCIEPREISLDFLGQHIPRFSVEEIKKGAMNDMANSKAGHYSKFYYPKKGGIDNLIKAISKRVKSVNLNEKVIEVDLTKKKVLTEKGGYSYKNLISTIPIKELAGIIKNAPEEIKEARSKLRCNKISFVLLGVKRKDICRYQWLYLPQKDILPFRISFQMNISKKMAPENTSSICSEYSYLEKREISDEELSERTIEDLIKMGIIKKRGEIIFKKVVDIPHAYVIYDFNRRENLNLIKDYLKKNNVHSIGRFGSWEHYSMENCILDSQKTSEKLR